MYFIANFTNISIQFIKRKQACYIGHPQNFCCERAPRKSKKCRRVGTDDAGSLASPKLAVDCPTCRQI